MSKSYGILCESDLGLDEFGNPIGDRFLMESVGEMLEIHEATSRAISIAEGGKFGRVLVVELNVVNEYKKEPF